MYKALNSWIYCGFNGEVSAERLIDFAVAEGLPGVELTVGDLIPIDSTEESVRKLAQYAAERNIRIRTLASGFYWGCSLSSEDETERCRAVEFTRKYLQIAAWIGAESILVVPGATEVKWMPSRPVQSYRSAWEISTRSIRELIPDAERLQVNIALENVWNRFLLSPMEWKFYLEQFDSDRIGLYFDAGNCCLNGRPLDYLDLVGGRIKAVHLKNFTGSDCAGGLHGFGEDLLAGDLDLDALTSAFEKSGYRGPFTVEMIPFCQGEKLQIPNADLAKTTVRKLLSIGKESK